MEAFREAFQMSWNSPVTAWCYCLLTLAWERLALWNDPVSFSFPRNWNGLFYRVFSISWMSASRTCSAGTIKNDGIATIFLNQTLPPATVSHPDLFELCRNHFIWWSFCCCFFPLMFFMAIFFQYVTVASWQNQILRPWDLSMRVKTTLPYISSFQQIICWAPISAT